MKAPRTVPINFNSNNEPLSAERRRFNRISLRENNNCNNSYDRPLFSHKLNKSNDWTENSQNHCDNVQPRRQSLTVDSTVFETSNSTQNRIILERRRTTEARRSFYLNNNENINASTSTINISGNRGGFHLRVGNCSPASDVLTNVCNVAANNQNYNPLSLSTISNPVAVTRPPTFVSFFI